MADADASRPAGATRLDDETLNYLKQSIAREHGLSEAQSRRLVGSTLRDLHADAVEMAKELGLRDPTVQTRDAGGRYATDVNALIRQAAGRTT
jgi:hypothetical protein